MKTSILILFVLFSFGVFAQESCITSPLFLNDKTTDNLPSIDENINNTQGSRATVSEWRYFSKALHLFLSNTSNKFIYTTLFPNVLNTTYTSSMGKSRYQSIGTCFSPNSEILGYYGDHKLYANQPYTLDSFSIDYNYMRYTGNSTPDTLIVSVYKPQKILYYTDNKIPKGGSAKYDSIANKGINSSFETKYLLTDKDTISYKPNGKGKLYFGLQNFSISPNSYGNPVAVTVSFKPGFSYKTTDTLVGDFNTNLPHSKINHFFFWNYTDYSDTPIEEFNNGLMIYAFTGSSKYKYETSNGAVYWRGNAFSGLISYPVIDFKISYDPDWVGQEEQLPAEFKIFPSPATSQITIQLNHLEDQATIEIIDQLGKVVIRRYLNNLIESLDISELNEGFYSLKLITPNSVQLKQFIISR